MEIENLIADKTFYVGASDRRIDLFENIYPLDKGVSYNSYLINDEKTCVMDACDDAVAKIFLANIATALDGKDLDYIVVQHMEPDHGASVVDVLKEYPNAKLVTNAKALVMFNQFFNYDVSNRTILVKEGDTLSLGEHTLTFVMTPMVHWPEVMMTYDNVSKVLFSADAFGTFGALSGNLFADKAFKSDEWKDEARRYYTNIVGKYGVQTMMALKKAQQLDIQTIASLHGPVWRKNLNDIISVYTKWATYQPEDNEVVVIYGSIYGHTARACDFLVNELDKLGVENIKMYDSSKVDTSYLLAETFRCSHVVIASSSYNAGVFTPIERYLQELVTHNVQNKKVAIIENGSWAPSAAKCITAALENLKNIEILTDKITVRGEVNSANEESLKELAQIICNSLKA